MISSPAIGLSTIYRRRIAVATKTVPGLIGLTVTPVLWILIVAPALAEALGGFSTDIDYYTFVAVGQVAFIIPFTSMFSGINVIVDKDFGILREMMAAPIPRASIPIGNALAVLSIALVQVAIIIVLAELRGAQFETSLAGVLWFIGAASFLSLITYGFAETLALLVGRQEAYGPLVPAVGVTPWFLAGALFPISLLPAGVEHLARALPWTHALALMRYGLMEGTDSGLTNIWHMDSAPLMAALSMATLAGMAVVSLAVAVQVFYRKTSA
ncbi:MAG: ABC transporter permease [Chloroflexi bacterium]|nr:ABC transporter permease [Chloroflexota bacterium]